MTLETAIAAVGIAIFAAGFLAGSVICGTACFVVGCALRVGKAADDGTHRPRYG